MLSIVQVIHSERGRRVARVDGTRLDILETPSTLSLIESTLDRGASLADVISQAVSSLQVSYDEVYAGLSDWTLLPPFDHPDEPNRLIVSGTGLTHKASAANRQAMHEAQSGNEESLTDSMRMYQWGLEGGTPPDGEIGAQPEWFYKGLGSIVRAHGEPLDVPTYADDGGEEPEIAGCYVIDRDGNPRRVGFLQGNEFADHVMEKKNYLYLAPSKLRDCSIGPELVIDAEFGAIKGTVRIERNGETIWSKVISSGNDHTCHSLANMEHHHFKYAAHRRPGDLHLHFYGADGFSFGEGVSLQDGDVMVVAWEGMGRALSNPLRVSEETDSLVAISPL